MPGDGLLRNEAEHYAVVCSTVGFSDHHLPDRPRYLRSLDAELGLTNRDVYVERDRRVPIATPSHHLAGADTHRSCLIDGADGFPKTRREHTRAEGMRRGMKSDGLHDLPDLSKRRPTGNRMSRVPVAAPIDGRTPFGGRKVSDPRVAGPSTSQAVSRR